MARLPDATRSLLGEPDFLKLWAAGGLTMTVRWMEILVIGVYTHALTRSALAVALVLFIRLCPTLLFGAFAGAIAERWDRRMLLLAILGTLTGASALLCALALLERIALWHIAIGAFLNGLYWSIEFPARRTLLGEVAGLRRIGAATGLDALTNHATRMAGPVLGGLLYETWGLVGPYALSTAAYAIAMTSLRALRFRSAVESAATGKVLRIIADGIAYIRTAPLVAGTLAVTMLVNFFGFSYASMVPVIGEGKFQLSPLPIGVLMSVEGIGATLGSLLIALNARPAMFPRIYLGGSAVFLAMVLLFSAAPTFAAALPLLLIGGFGIAGFGAMQTALALTATAPEMRRRVIGVLVVCIGAGPLGVLHTGVLADWLGADTAIGLISLEGLLALGFCARKWPELYRPLRVTASS